MAPRQMCELFLAFGLFAQVFEFFLFFGELLFFLFLDFDGGAPGGNCPSAGEPKTD